MSVFTIAIDRRFADELAMGVLAQHGGDPLALADLLILLPTRRSVRALREAFLRAANGKPTILPRMAPLGDVDESEWEVASGDGSALALPPAIEPAERDALLLDRAQLVTEARFAARTFAHTYAVPMPAARTKTMIAITSACCGWLNAEKKFAIDTPIRFGADGPVRYGTVKLPRT